MRKERKIFLKIDPELRRFVLKAENKELKTLTKLENELLKNAIDKKLLYTENNIIKQTQKVIEYKKSYVLNTQLKNKEIEFKKGNIDKENYLFYLNTLIERIEIMKNEADEIEKKLMSCEHQFIPKEAYIETNILNRFSYRWILKCKHCNKEKVIGTETAEKPEGFENISLQNRTILIR